MKTWLQSTMSDGRLPRLCIHTFHPAKIPKEFRRKFSEEVPPVQPSDVIYELGEAANSRRHQSAVENAPPVSQYAQKWCHRMWHSVSAALTRKTRKLQKTLGWNNVWQKYRAIMTKALQFDERIMAAWTGALMDALELYCMLWSFLTITVFKRIC